MPGETAADAAADAGLHAKKGYEQGDVLCS